MKSSYHVQKKKCYLAKENWASLGNKAGGREMVGLLLTRSSMLSMC